VRELWEIQRSSYKERVVFGKKEKRLATKRKSQTQEKTHRGTTSKEEVFVAREKGEMLRL